MNMEVIEYLINEDYRLLIDEDGFSPQLAYIIVMERLANGVYDTYTN